MSLVSTHDMEIKKKSTQMQKQTLGWYLRWNFIIRNDPGSFFLKKINNFGCLGRKFLMPVTSMLVREWTKISIRKKIWMLGSNLWWNFMLRNIPGFSFLKLTILSPWEELENLRKWDCCGGLISLAVFQQLTCKALFHSVVVVGAQAWVPSHDDYHCYLFRLL